jgi:two-component system chemotaxis response regulator CheY
VSTIAILCIEDEPEVRAALQRDLAEFDGPFTVEFTEDVAEAREVVAGFAAAGTRLGLVLADHLLPGMRGIDYLIELHAGDDTRPARKVLITGQAGLDDTVRAVNDAGLDHFIAKPWDQSDLVAVARDQLTGFVIDSGEDVLPYVAVLDGSRLLDAMRGRDWRDRRT